MEKVRKLGIITAKTNDMCHRFYNATYNVGSSNYSKLTEEQLDDLIDRMSKSHIELQLILRRLDKYNITNKL